MINKETDARTLTLAQVPSHFTVQVVHIEAGHKAQLRLNQLGIHTGEILYVKGGASFQGPILIQVHSSQIAIGRGMAAKITVQVVNAK